MWDYPTTPGVNNATSQLSKVLTSTTASSFLLGSMPVLTLPVNGLPRVDVSAWVLGSQTMVSIVNLGYVDSDARVSITLPEAVKSLPTTLWGNGSWVIDGEVLSKSGMEGLEVDISSWTFEVSSGTWSVPVSQ